MSSFIEKREDRERREQAARVEKIARFAAEKLAAFGTNIELCFEEDDPEPRITVDADTMNVIDVAQKLAASATAARTTFHALIAWTNATEDGLAAVAAVVAAHAGFVVMPPPEPSPKDAAGPIVWDEVIADLDADVHSKSSFSNAIVNLVQLDMKERDRVGRARYGKPLQANNGRDALKDAYEEGLDKTVYKRQALDEILDGPTDFETVVRMSELVIDRGDEFISPLGVDRVVRARSYLLSLRSTLADREEIERRNDANRRSDPNPT